MSFIIVGRDRPVYELPMSGGREELARQSQFILHAALDMVELNMQANPLTCVGGRRWREDQRVVGWKAKRQALQVMLRRALQVVHGGLRALPRCGHIS